MTRKQNGTAMVEFALLLPLLLLLTFITTEYSRALYQYNILTKSVRDAARYLSTQTPWTIPNQNLPANTAVQLIAKNLVVYGNPAGTGAPLALGLTTAKVDTPVWQKTGSAPVINTVTIQIGFGLNGSATRYRFVPLFASVFGVSFGSAEFAPITATMRGSL